MSDIDFIAQLDKKGFLCFLPGDLIFLHGMTFLVLNKPNFFRYLGARYNPRNIVDEYEIVCFGFHKNQITHLYGIAEDRFPYISGI